MREFVRAEIWPLETLALEHAALRLALAPIQAEVKRRGLWAAHLPPHLGGSGFGQVKLGLMHEILGSSPLGPIGFGNQAPDSGNSEILALAGTPEQRRRWLGPLLAGEIMSCFSMTERERAGSDPTVLDTTATLDGDTWLIEGEKWFSSNASVADLLIVVATTDQDAAPHRRASMFLVPADTAGVEVIRDIPTIEHPWPSFGVYGNHAEVRYEGVRVPREALLGERGGAFAIAQERLGPGRIHHCMRWLGVSRRAFDMLCERATYRVAQNELLGEKGVVRSWIADSAAEMSAARLMTLHAAWKIDTVGARAARAEISMIKFFGAQVLHRVVDRALQIHGSLGYSTDLPLEAMYRAARGARFYDGPDEVHRDLVARLILREYQPPDDGVPTEHVPTRRAAAEARFASFLDAATANG
ncbi:MAG: acyl-CoA dehydrogenase family protein [Actinobacteria bacterium]|nr:acyl-CoA dehydrogenase family protein [Actinomycetota bacterium]